MSNWVPIQSASAVRKARHAVVNSTTRDAAFAEMSPQELRVDRANEGSSEPDKGTSLAANLQSAIEQQLQAIETQKARLAELMRSLPQIPE